MSGYSQDTLRNKLCDLMLGAVTSGEVTHIEAVAAAQSVLSVIIAALPEKTHERVVEIANETLLCHVQRRAKEIRTGQFDTQAAQN